MEYGIGFLIALAVGLTGVGAGSITAPVLMLFLGRSPVESVGTALVFAAVIKWSVLPVYWWRKQIHYGVLGLLCAGGIPGVMVGFFLLERLDVAKQGRALFLVLGLTVAILALFNLYRAFKQKVWAPSKDRSRWLPGIAAAIGAEVGFLSAGAGALGSVALLGLTPLTPAQVVGTDMVFGLVLSTIGGGLHLSVGHYDSVLLWKLIAGGIAGALIGANFSALLPARPLRLVMSTWLTFIGAQLAWKAWG
ncbi:MAG: sulfite exporter TauE/SafE family protein [Bryobacteraceae bacterium]